MPLIMKISTLRCFLRSAKASVHLQRSLSTASLEQTNHKFTSFVSKPQQLIHTRNHHCKSDNMIPQQIPFSSDFFFRQVSFLIIMKGVNLLKGKF